MWCRPQATALLRASAFVELPLHPEIGARARAVQSLLARRSQHRAAGVVDLTTAAVAEHHQASVLHDDSDLDHIASASGQHAMGGAARFGRVSADARAGTIARTVPTVLYDGLFSALATRVDAELAHRVGFGAIRAAGAVPVARVVLTRALRAGLPASAAPVHAMGLRFRSPLGLAAGFDKDGVGVLGLAALGFGFLEIGTVTPRAQPGNPVPRVFRLPADRALVNRLGFNNGGAAEVADRLRRTREDPGFPADLVVGLNIGRNRTTPDADAVTDYATGARLLSPVADYLVVNVSSPNTPGLRDLQAVDRLRPVLSAVLAEAGAVPVLVKIAPDLADTDVDAVADLALGAGLVGVVATNTTLSRAGLRSSAAAVAGAGAGGLSGPPLRTRSLAVVERLARRAGDRLTVVAAGGIGSGADARRALDAGASLVQAYTGFVYGGPLWPRRVTRDLAIGN